MLTGEQRAAFAEQLEKTKTRLETEIKELGKTPDFGDEPDHFEEKADEAEEYSANLGMGQTLKQRLENVVRALEKMARGAYGTCEQCGNDIELAVLETDPESRFCKACKLQQTENR